MCDGEGALGDPDLAARIQAVENHYRWVEAARFLGCHSIRVNAQSQGTPEEQRDLAADGLRRLVEFADTARDQRPRGKSWGPFVQRGLARQRHAGREPSPLWDPSRLRQLQYRGWGELRPLPGD